MLNRLSRRNTWVAFAILAFVATSSAMAARPGEPIRVQLWINATDLDRPRLESLLGGDLRSLGDVVVVDSKPDFYLHITGGPSGIPSDPCSVYVITMVVAVGDQRLYADDTLVMGPYSSLRSLCEDLIVYLDTNHISKLRKVMQTHPR
jgi:hypothetical protein